MIITSTRVRGGKIRAANAVDPYFNLVTLLLPANGANGAQNQTFVDGSSNNFTMTPTGNPMQGTVSPFSPSGYSNYFDGSGYFALAANSAFLFTGDFTIEAWVNLPAVTGGPYTIFGSRYSASTTVFDFRVFNSNIQVSLNAGSGTNLGLGTLSTNRWAHMALVRSGSSIKCYVDGTQTATTLTNSSTLGFSDVAMAVGASGTVGSNQFRGYISNLRILNGTALYTSNFTPPSSNLTAIANTSLLTCQNNRFIDNSSNGFLLTPSGQGGVTPFVRPFSPFAPENQYTTAANGGTAAFDGTGDYIRTGAVDQTAFEFGTGDFTWECWIYPMSDGSNRIIGFATTAGTLQAQLLISGTTITYDQVGGSTPYSQTYSQTFNHQWSHIAVSRVSGTSRVFVNGVQLGASFADTKNFAASRFAMATNPTSQIVYYYGYITGVKIVKGTGLYTANFPCPTALPTATNAQLLLNFTNAGIVDAAAKNNLETVGNTILSTAQSKWATSSIFFDGTGDWLLGARVNGFDNLLRTGNFTIELWVYLASADVGSARGLVSKGTAGAGYSVSLDSTQKVVFNFDASNITSTGSIPTDSWVHIAVVRAGTGANLTKIYINGVNDGTGTVSTDFSQTNSQYVGADRVGGSPMKGYMQDLRITRGLARYTANFSPPSAPFPTQ